MAVADNGDGQKIIKNRYVLSDEIRSGGMSTVVRAYDIKKHRTCAIKRMSDKSDQLRLKESVNREGSALTELAEHPNIVTLLDIDYGEEGTFLVLEWIYQQEHLARGAPEPCP